MKSSYLLAATPPQTLLPLLLRNGVSIGPRYMARLAFVLQSSPWSTFLDLREKLINAKRIAKAPVPEDPIFIVGHWRTGSTFLHQLLNCDPQLAVPTLFHISYPGSFMSSRGFVEPIMNRLVLPKRPMDNVRLGMDEPQEEEGALFRMTGLSPFERLIFPTSQRYFLLDENERLMPPPNKVAQWKKSLQTFVKKVHVHTGKRVVLKNPFHSMRIPLLAEMFPKAQFIHIRRDPIEVVPSTVHMWTVVGNENTMKKGGRPPTMEEAAQYLAIMLERIETDLSSLRTSRCSEINFSDLEAKPKVSIKALYKTLGLEFNTITETNVQGLLDRESSYTKNTFEMSPAQKDMIRAIVR